MNAERRSRKSASRRSSNRQCNNRPRNKYDYGIVLRMDSHNASAHAGLRRWTRPKKCTSSEEIPGHAGCL